MATTIPAPLKAADVQRFAVRASQVERAKPAAAYWCYYYVLDKILSKGLHKASDESQAYVVELMDKVEKMKTEHADDDAMRDDMAGKAYIEQFGLETFMRADNAIRSNKATKQTADTFQAAYTFLDLLNIWPPVEPEITSRIKFAKYHAVRIAKAIKAGEDPNLSNPAPEAEDEDGLGAAIPAVPALDAEDPEVRAINGLGPTSPAVDTSSITPISPPPATTDSQGGLPQFVDRPPVSPQDDGPISLPPYPNEHSSHATQAMPHQNAESFYQNAGSGNNNNNNTTTTNNQSDVSPLPQSDSSAGYFPPVPPTSTSADSGTAPSPGPTGGGGGGGALSPSLPHHQPRPHHAQPPPPPPPAAQNPRSALGGPAIVPPPPNPADASSPLHLGPSHPPYTSSPSHASTQPVPSAPGPPFRAQASPAFAAPPPPPPPMNQQHYQQQQQQYEPVAEVDEEAMVRAQKHARFAISALNFEDVATAVKELRAALTDLGAR